MEGGIEASGEDASSRTRGASRSFAGSPRSCAALSAFGGLSFPDATDLCPETIDVGATLRGDTQGMGQNSFGRSEVTQGEFAAGPGEPQVGP